MKYHLLMVLAIALVVVRANENSDGSKVKIIDNSRVLTADEVANLPDKDKIPVVVPLLKNPSAPVIMPKIGVVVKSDEPSSAKSAIDQKAADAINNNNNNDAKLQPIPLIMPSFLNNVFDQPIMDDSLGGESGSVASSGDDKPSGILNVLVLRSHRVEDPSNPDSGVKSSFVIMRFLPKSIGNWFGLDSSDAEQQKLLGGGDDDVDKKRIHLFGGDDDIDHKRMHLLGGGDDDVDKKRMMHGMMGGEGDPDHMRIDRIGLDENSKGVFTGGSEDVFSNTAEQQHKIFVFSMFDRLRSMFDNMRQTFEQQVPSFSVDSSESDPSKMESVVPFISIRTDDGQSALIPNDIGYAEKQQHEKSLNKCMMLQFMRLKASMYYRTILHLLFFTGVLLFIFSLFMLMVRACRRRQLARRHHHHHHHHRNMSIASIEAGKSKLAAYKAWQGMDQSSLIDSDKVVLIQAPPAYDQVFIQDKNSTLTSSAAHPSFSTEKSSDECETKSLPPDYEENKAAEK